MGRPALCAAILAFAAVGAAAPAQAAFPGENGRIVYEQSGTPEGELQAEGLYTIGRKGGDRTLLAEGGVTPAWSADGRWVVYSFASEDLRLIRRNGRDTRPVISGGTEPSFGPRGGRIVFSADRIASRWDREQQDYISCYLFGCPDVGIWLVNRDGSGVRNLTEPRANEEGGTFDRGPEFSPNGRRIVFEHVENPEASGEIRTMRVDGSGQRVLTDDDSSNPSFAPDGKQIVFQHDLSGRGPYASDILLMNANGTNRRRVTRNGFDPAFSPNGEWIVFSRPKTDPAGADLFRVRVDGSDVQRLTDDAKDAGESSVDLQTPDWGPRPKPAR